MQKKLTKGPLLDENGTLIETGYATTLIKSYDREKIKASNLRIKEWDYFFIQNESFGLALTVADNAYMGLISVTLLDFSKRSYHTKTKIIPFPMGKMGLPDNTRQGGILIERKGISFDYTYENGKKHLKVYFADFKDNRPLKADITLQDEPEDSMVIAIPFKNKPKHFYYNQKIPGIRASGYVSDGEKNRTLGSESLAVMDWGRGVWPYDVTWYWGLAQGYHEGKRFALNIGHGFGDTSDASENMIFFEGKAHKLTHGRFIIPTDGKGRYNYLDNWSFSTDDNRLDVIFKPIVDRKDKINLGLLKSDQHQVFGYFEGKAILDNKEVVTFKNLFGFAELIRNKW